MSWTLDDNNIFVCKNCGHNTSYFSDIKKTNERIQLEKIVLEKGRRLASIILYRNTNSIEHNTKAEIIKTCCACGSDNLFIGDSNEVNLITWQHTNKKGKWSNIKFHPSDRDDNIRNKFIIDKI